MGELLILLLVLFVLGAGGAILDRVCQRRPTHDDDWTSESQGPLRW